MTPFVKKKDIKKKWYLIDADGLVLGRLASKIAFILRGKHKTIFTPHLDCGDNVIVINAKKVMMTGNKVKEKKYYKHTGYPGGLKELYFKDIIKGTNAESVIKKAVETQKEVQRHYEQYNFHLLTQVIHGFCVNELGAFYLDVIKDRQYTCKKNSKERISAQQSMYFLTKMLLTWIAPICPHTAEEAWQHIPKNNKGSIFLNNWFDLDINNLAQCSISETNWNDILEVKNPISILSNTTPIKKKSEHIFFDLPKKIEMLKDFIKKVDLQKSIKNKFSIYVGSPAKEIER